MALILEGISLAIEGAALVIDCACCISEKCEAIVCAKDVDCDEAGKSPDAECFCRAKKCTSNPSCVNDDDCPDGQECVNGLCVDKCRGQPCGGDGDCDDNCVCIEGGCWNESSVYYCHGDPQDTNANGDCKKGVPELSKGGPYLSYGLCAQSGCNANFSCNSVICDCYPDPAGIYADLVSCQQGCCGGSGDLGRCCESRVTYDANGDVTNVVQGEGACCPRCTKDQCISDPPLQNGQAGTRVFRQFNSLFDNCELCPNVTLGPCCYEKDGQPTCDMHDRGECENVLDGEWKGNNWFDCENARDPDVDLLLDFACPMCNGAGDCSCADDEYCYGQKCVECSSPTPVNSNGYVLFDNNPKSGDEWKFRSRDCNEGVSTQDQTIDIYGVKKEDGTLVFLTSVDNSSDLDSFGRTSWTNDSNEYRSLAARKKVGSPDNAVLCHQKTQKPIVCLYRQDDKGVCRAYDVAQYNSDCYATAAECEAAIAEDIEAMKQDPNNFFEGSLIECFDAIGGYVDNRATLVDYGCPPDKPFYYETYYRQPDLGGFEGSPTGQCALSYDVGITEEDCVDKGLSPLPGGISDEDYNALLSPEWAPTFPDVNLGWFMTHCKIVFGEDACDGIICAELESCPDMPQQRCPENFRSKNPLP